MVVQPQLRIGSIDTSVAGDRIANGYDGFGFLLIKALAVDAILFVFFRALFRGGPVLLPVRVTNRAFRVGAQHKSYSLGFSFVFITRHAFGLRRAPIYKTGHIGLRGPSRV